MHRTHVLHENDDWPAPLFAALELRGLPYASSHLAEGGVNPHASPPAGVFYNRINASRTHVVIDGRALEIDKLGQYAALEAAGIRLPRTSVARPTPAPESRR